MRSILRAFGHDVRIGGVDAVDVGVDLADVGLERRRDRDAGGVRAAAAERGDVAVVVDALEAGDDRDLALLERVVDRLRVDRLDARARERAVGDDAHLRAEERLRAAARLLDGERDQADRDLLAGRRDDVELALVSGGGSVVDLLGEREQAVGLARHRRDDDHDVVARALRRRGSACATSRMRSMVPTEVPPYFCTMSIAAALLEHARRDDYRQLGDIIIPGALSGASIAPVR